MEGFIGDRLYEDILTRTIRMCYLSEDLVLMFRRFRVFTTSGEPLENTGTRFGDDTDPLSDRRMRTDHHRQMVDWLTEEIYVRVERDTSRSRRCL